MKNLKLRGHKLGWKLLIMATVALVFSVVFAVYQLNFTQAIAQDEAFDQGQDLSLNQTIDIDRNEIGNDPYNVLFHIFTDAQFTYEDLLEQPPVEKTDNVLRATFNTATRVILKADNKDSSIYYLFGFDSKSQRVDHNYKISCGNNYGFTMLSTNYFDSRNYEASLIIGKKYTITLNANEGHFYGGSTEYTYEAIENTNFIPPDISRDGYNFLGYTYDGHEGPYIKELTLIPAEGIWADTLYAVWEPCIDNYAITFDTNDESSQFVYEWETTIDDHTELKHGRLDSIDYKKLLNEGDDVNDLHVGSYGWRSYTISWRNTNKDGKDVHNIFSFYVENPNNKIVDKVFCNGEEQHEAFGYGNDGEFIKLKFNLELKDSQPVNISVQSANKALFNCCKKINKFEESDVVEYFKTGDLNIEFPAGYYVDYYYGAGEFGPEDDENSFLLNSNALVKYNGITLMISAKKDYLDEKDGFIHVDSIEYVINDIFADSSLEKKTEIKSVEYDGKQLVPTPRTFPIKNTNNVFLLDVIDNNPTVYEARFYANGGHFACSNASSDVVELSQQVTTTYNFPQDPTREGYEFAGWYSDPEGGDLYTTDTYVWDPEDESEENTDMFYAHWIPAGGGSELAQTGDANAAIAIMLMMIAALSSVAILRMRKN